MRSQGVAFGLLLAAACVPASAQLTYLSQDRSVSAYLNFGDSGGEQAPGFGPFHGVAYATPDMMYGGSASATQNSTLEPGKSLFPAACRPKSRRPRARGVPVPTQA